MESIKAAHRPLSALLSQVLVALTIEIDNEFELGMADAGYPGARLSVVVWSNLMRFLTGGDTTVDALVQSSLMPKESIRGQLGCLERWRFVRVGPTLGAGSGSKRDGWASSRGIRLDWKVGLTRMGNCAVEIWPVALPTVESRWQSRFTSSESQDLRASLQAIVDQLETKLPWGLPEGPDPNRTYPPKDTTPSPLASIHTLLSQVLHAFTIDFDRESPTPLELCANTLRVLEDTTIRLAEIPALTGCSPETSDIGWMLKPYVTVARDPTGKPGKIVFLNSRGVEAVDRYHQIAKEVEARWQERIGQNIMTTLRNSLEGLLCPSAEGKSRIADGLIPPPGVVRAGAKIPALGRKDLGAAALQRRRDLVAQTEVYINDPWTSLPHYPLWDMNRGFGP